MTSNLYSNYGPHSTDAYGNVYDTNTYNTGAYDTSNYGTTGYGANRTTYDPTTGAYDQHIDYDRDASTRRHHREQVDDSGRYYHRDVDRDTSGLDNTTRVHKEYSNPNTGTSYHRDSTYDHNNVV
ncbi:hypothetical protein BGW36DRAFT_372019 [Talaromyces proteolyticus]|uniref:Uncharacterized protein n=1 Tax=Talaromyces proteolyticus TaxID=1131652 RepID=A0AAD4Q3Q0_9EURO|nr:uncharacterized protein BGW36DRAFT_372019 [Talaromyces proteolyticus]KAH8702006.1 hypothetical protein BGW36DRAFT_372019 [Talaromyces proteolyticus]